MDDLVNVDWQRKERQKRYQTRYVTGYLRNSRHTNRYRKHLLLMAKKQPNRQPVDGPVDAAFTAIRKIVKHKGKLEEFLIQAITRGSDDMGKVHISVEHKGVLYYGFWSQHRYRNCFC